MKKLQAIKNLKKEVWRLCSQFIRMRDCPGGKGKCITCENKIYYNNCNAGHYIHGSTKPTWLLEENIHAQCVHCNLYLSGNESIYTLKMIDKYGRNKVDNLWKLSKKEHVYNREELNERKQYFVDKINQLSLI